MSEPRERETTERTLISDVECAATSVLGWALSLDNDYPRDEDWAAAARRQLNEALDAYRNAYALLMAFDLSRRSPQGGRKEGE